MRQILKRKINRRYRLWFSFLLDSDIIRSSSCESRLCGYSDLVTQISASTVAVELTRTTVLTDASDEELRLEA